MQTKRSEIWVGAFMLLALCALIFLALQVANVKSLSSEATYRIYANFDNIGGLKTNSPVKIGGVVVGRVAEITLDGQNYTPRVALDINAKYNRIPDTSSLAIRTSGLLGEQYLALNIGFEDPEMGTQLLQQGSTLQDTKSAMVLEDLIGQFLYSNNSQNRTSQGTSNSNGSTSNAVDSTSSH
ncbi:outer membrane lipid asymmetry maintenance protein MlaD [Serratia microhaemolytica]|uniref:outer membrane lipid asymmetry maintenance protein MlaD n=1 Tax=Serratia microhaemolytica TaxID=2675110 RepID=UPI000FDE1885|nr:outer membrane lipid asymmetry maintenance protein MlaD [Serratia microhaemolytica]